MTESTLTIKPIVFSPPHSSLKMFQEARGLVMGFTNSSPCLLCFLSCGRHNLSHTVQLSIISSVFRPCTLPQPKHPHQTPEIYIKTFQDKKQVQFGFMDLGLMVLKAMHWDSMMFNSLHHAQLQWIPKCYPINSERKIVNSMLKWGPPDQDLMSYI